MSDTNESVATLAGTEIAGGLQDSDLIDAHVHVWTPHTESYPLAEGYRKSEMSPSSFTPKQLFAHCRPSGVNRVVLIQMSYYRFDNSYMLDVMRAYPGVFSGVAVIDMNDDPISKMKQLKELGVRGFRIRPQSDESPDSWLERDGMKAMWECGSDEGLAMCHLIDPVYLPSVDKMCQRDGSTPVVIDHFARIGIDGQIRESDLANLSRLARHPHVRVKISAYYALGKKQAPYRDLGPMIRRMLDAFGPERLMWASDCPFQVVEGHQYAPSIDLIKNGLDFLSDSDKKWLLRDTAAKQFYW